MPGMLGPAFVLLPLSLLALRHAQGRKLLLAGLVYALPRFLEYPGKFGSSFRQSLSWRWPWV